MNPDEGHEETPTAQLDRLPPGAEQALDQEGIRAALVITRRVHRTNPTLSPAINPEPGEVWRLSDEIKWLEADAIHQWAVGIDWLLNAGHFTRQWQEGGCIEGGENQIYLAGALVYKRNNLAFHTSYLEFFERLALHNWLFPDTAYTFIGLMWDQTDEIGQLKPVITQQALRGVRGATRNEVEAEMTRMGFHRRYEDNYANLAQTLLVEDLHDQNVLVDADGDLFIFDPVIYLSPPT